MKKSGYKLLLPALTMMAISALMTSCVFGAAAQKQQPAPSPATSVAQFAFTPIQVTPLPVITGKPFTVTMKVSNTGAAPGTYKADLYIDGSMVSSQSVMVNPGQSANAEFHVNPQDTGHHIFGIGSQTLDVTVVENRAPVIVKIDNGQVDGCDPVAQSVPNASEVTVQDSGNMIKLTAPPGGFTVTAVEILGYIKDSTYDFNRDPVIGGPGLWVYGADVAMAEPVRPDFTVNIYGNHRNKLFSGNYNKSLFSYSPAFVTVPVSNVKVDGDFYIEVLTYNLPRLNVSGAWDHDYFRRYVVHTWYYQLCIGYESAIDIESWVSEGGSAVPDRYLTYNWLIRADGYQTPN